MAHQAADQQARDEDARAFIDADVARAYRQRPPYPEALFEELSRTVIGNRAVLDLGCGTGDLCRRLAPYVERIDAVDVSEPMMAAGRAAPGGNSPKITWHGSTAEDFTHNGPYGLAVAGERLHWMELATVLPKVAAALSSRARFALISREEAAPWSSDFLRIIPGFSAAKAYRPRDLVAEIESAGLGEC
jgi:predicted TPR repeat methyltransferase